MRDYEPGYIKLSQTGELDERVKALKERLKICIVCPHHCKVDRPSNERGFCRAGAAMVLDGYGPHLGEEDVLWERADQEQFSSAIALYNVYSAKTVR